MRRRSPLALPLVAILFVSVSSVRAEETTADWLKKTLDPSTLGVPAFPGSTLNRKVTVDTIRYDRAAPSAKRTAVYIAPLDQMDAAVHHFAQALGMQPLSDNDAKGNPRHLFVVTGEGGQPARAKGLRVSIMRSPWVDGTTQIQMDYLPPGSAS